MKSHFEALKKALLAERTYEVESYRSLVNDKPMKDRVAEGVTIYPLDYYDQRYSTFDELILDFRFNAEQSGKLFGTNGKCQLFNSQNSEICDAIVLKITDGKISIVIHADESPDWIKEGKIGLNAVCDTRTYDIQLKVLDELADSQRGLAYDFYNKTFEGYPAENFQEDESLNASQNKAVKAILSSAALHVVHGPPGTGKTKTLVSAIVKLKREGKRILVAAPTNAAADHITEQIFKAGHDVLRYGHSFKIDAKVEELTLYSRIEKHPDLQVIARLKKDSDLIRKKAFRHVRNFGPEEQAERRQLKADLKAIQKDIREIEKRIREFTVEKAAIISGTIIGLQSDELNRQKFDVVIVDEAGQALEPAIWSIARSGDKLIMAGDPFQLPPTLFSNNAQKSELGVSLIERAMERNHPTTLLDTQYRMHDSIMQFSNHKFYQDKLISAPQVKDRKLEDDDFSPFEFIDTAGCGNEESFDQSGGIFNSGEASTLIKRLSEFAGTSKSIGVISPYRKQVTFLREQIEDLSITVQTIDSFQGQERDIILISLVRSNDNQQIGFLSDYRRMNVAMTRAKLKLIIIGDSATLGSDSFYQDLLTWVEEKGTYRSAYEFLD
ncbi:MAG: AAA family ATPase [Crocinitomicaceae bacterium]|nr:AAA family ATPase [Crocinitomicaceae bacterium]